MSRKKSRRDVPAKKSFRCHRCETSIRITPGWSLGASVRRHYWRRHAEVMRQGRIG